MQDKKRTILAVSGSLRSNSSNALIIKEIQKWVPQHITFTIYQDMATLPAFDDSMETPEPVVAWRRLLAVADGVLICSPEYAFGIPGALKNAMDWTVGSGELVNKPLVLVTAATGGDKAHAAWLQIFTALSANIPDGGSLLIPFVRSKLNEKGEVSDVATREALQSILRVLINSIE
jgi:chromate reductase, NAD(P)H dehydrogenase (quinone)